MALAHAAIEIVGSILLLCLVFGMSASVDVTVLQNQLHNYKAIASGLFLQFIVMPFLGFFFAKMLILDRSTGLILLVLTSSPGGSYSNWFCSIFNGDLALSVAMTSISTILSVVMLPFNLFVYSLLAYEDAVGEFMQWPAIFGTLLVVIVGIAAGMVASHKHPTTRFHSLANRIGNAAGMLLVIMSATVSNSDAEMRLWHHDWQFYVGVAMPCILGLIIATALSTGLDLLKPERVTVSVECCIQNCGIAISVSLSMFEGNELARAMAVPFYYGIVECVVITIFCLSMWKLGWTKAPTNISLWQMLVTPYDVLSWSPEKNDPEADGFHYVDGKDGIASPDSAELNVPIPCVRVCTV